MKTKIAFLIISIIIFQNCEKNDNTCNTDNFIIGDQNNCIIYTDIEPDKVLHHAGYNYPDELYLLDINKDTIDDLKFLIYYYTSNGGHTQGFKISVTAINNDISILGNNIIPKMLCYGDTLTMANEWNSKYYLLSGLDCCCPSNSPEIKCSFGYLAIKFKNKLGWIRFDIQSANTILLYDYAVEK
jgi:hypothetical protein